VPSNSPIDIDLSIDTRVLVDVRDSAGVPRGLFPIALRGLDGRYVKSTTDTHGLARFSRLSPGGYVVEVNHFLQDVHGDKRPPSRPDQTISIELRTGEEKRVEIVIPASPRFARLVVNGSDSHVGWKARGAANVWTDIEPNGRIPIDIRGTPALTITAANAHEWTALLPKDAPDGYLVRIDLVGIGYEGVVKSQENGEPLRGLRIVAKPWDDQAQPKLVTTVVSDENGHFTLTGLTDDTYFIRFEDVPPTEMRGGFAIHTTAKPSSPPGLLELVLPTRKTVGHDKLVASGFEGYAEIPLSGVIRGAAKGSQVSGSIAAELPRNGYKLLLWIAFHANVDGAFHVNVPSAPAFAASLMDATTGEWIGYVEWRASGATDEQTHDIEIP